MEMLANTLVVTILQSVSLSINMLYTRLHNVTCQHAYTKGFAMAQQVKNLPAMQEMWV